MGEFENLKMGHLRCGAAAPRVYRRGHGDAEVIS